MKKLIVLFALLLATNVYAEEYHHSKSSVFDSDLGNKDIDVEVGYSHNIIQFTDFINLQGSAGKDVNGTDLKEGWIFRIYFTNAKPIINLKKDK